MKTCFQLFVALLVLSPINAFADKKNEPKLFGAWDLVTFTVSDKSGTKTSFCDGVNGGIIYEKSGAVSVAINCAEKRAAGEPADQYGGMLFYAGTYKIQGQEVIHKIKNSNVANLIGKEASRHVDVVNATDLVLSGTLGTSPFQIRLRRAPLQPELDPKKELVIFTYLKLKPGVEAKFMSEFSKIIEPSLSEPGNIAWLVQKSESDPNEIVFYTRWLNDAALNSHLKSAPLATYIKNSASLLAPGVAPRLVRYHPIDN